MRSMIRAVLALALIAIVGMFLFGYWTGSAWRPGSATTKPATVGTSGTIVRRRRARGRDRCRRPSCTKVQKPSARRN